MSHADIWGWAEEERINNTNVLKQKNAWHFLEISGMAGSRMSNRKREVDEIREQSSI